MRSRRRGEVVQADLIVTSRVAEDVMMVSSKPGLRESFLSLDYKMQDSLTTDLYWNCKISVPTP